MAYDDYTIVDFDEMTKHNDKIRYELTADFKIRVINKGKNKIRTYPMFLWDSSTDLWAFVVQQTKTLYFFYWFM